MLKICYNDNMDYDLYKVFISVAENNSFSKASKELMISQSTVSSCINKLENYLKLKLFDRDGKKISITDNGKNLLSYLNQGEKFFRTAEDFLFQKNNNKKIKFACTNTMSSVILLPYLKEYQKKHFDATFDIFSRSGPKDRISLIENNVYDFALVVDKDINTSKNVIASKIAEVNYCFMFNPKYFELNENSNLDEILNHHILIQSIGELANNYFYEIIGDKKPLRISEFFHSDILIEAVHLGMGVGFAPKEYIRDREIKCINEFNKKVDIYLLYKKENKKLAKEIFNL